VDGFHLWSASYEWHSSIGADGGDELSVEVAAAPPAADLRPLLAALLPRGADLERDLAGLDVAACGKGAAGAQLPHLPRLQLLVASGFCWPGGLPRSVAQCTALLELSLVGNQLDALPLGPYLAGARRLRCGRKTLAGLGWAAQLACCYLLVHAAQGRVSCAVLIEAPPPTHPHPPSHPQEQA
jgi:hypothetical protein